MKLTVLDRTMLWNQYEILKHLDEGNKDHYEQLQDILEHGYELLYGDVSQHLYDDTMSRGECEEVIEILNLYRALHFSMRDLRYDSDHHWAKFLGFDGNNETKHMAFADFLREKQGRWEELRGRPSNSHMPTLDSYRPMLARWTALGKKHELSREEIDQILAAAYPNR